MRQVIRDELDKVDSRISVATLCWLDTACEQDEFDRWDVWQELRRRRQQDPEYPEPTPLQFDAGLKQAIAEGAVERFGQRFRSRIRRKGDR